MATGEATGDQKTAVNGSDLKIDKTSKGGAESNLKQILKLAARSLKSLLTPICKLKQELKFLLKFLDFL